MPSAAPSAEVIDQASKLASVKARAAASSSARAARAASQARRSGLAAAMRAQPEAKARRPGASDALDHPGIAANGTCWSFASAVRGVAAGQAGQGGCGAVLQPTSIRITRTSAARTRAMWVIYVEMGIALVILVLIVWFTWPRKRPPQDKDAD